MKAIGWNLGQRGDIIMNTVVARGFKEMYPDSHLTLGIYKAYSDMKDLFKNHKYIDDIHIYDSYENWPNEKDIDFLKKSNFDKVYHGMPNHTRDDWYNHCKSFTEETCLMNGINPPKNLQCTLTKWFDTNPKYNNYICIAPFSSAANKDLSISNCNLIIDFIKTLGYNILQLSSNTQPKIDNCTHCTTNYFESVVNMLSCKALITVDTGMALAASAYSHKVLGLYGMYHGLKTSRVYEPINPNAIYLSAKNVNDIDIESIKDSLVKILK